MRREETFVVGERTQLEVTVPAGRIQVAAGHDGEVKVSIDAHDTDTFEIFQIGDSVTIREEWRRRSRNRHVRVLIVAPAGFDVAAQTGSADVEIRGRAGTVKSRTGSGDLDVERAERLDATAASGQIRIGTVSGDVRCNSASGDIVVQTTEGQLDASTSSGDVDATRVLDQINIGTASGDVEVAQCDGDMITIKTLSGSIRLGLPTGIRVEPDISTMSGRVVLPEPATSPQPQDRRTVRVRLNSMSGNIRIERAG